MADELPDSITIRGGMFQTGREANGIWVSHADVGNLPESQNEVPYVIDHNMGIDAVAGFVKNITAEEFDIQVPLVDGSERTERAVLIKHETVITSDFPAYERVARSILAHQKNGRVPQESVSFSAKALNYEAESDRLILSGIGLVHHSHVSKGAHGPEHGVGAFDIDFGPTMIEARNAAGELKAQFVSESNARIVNMEDLVANFTVEYANNSGAMRRLADAYVREQTPDEALEPEDVPNDGTFKDEAAIPSHSDDNRGYHSNTPLSIVEDEDIMSDEIQPTEMQVEAVKLVIEEALAPLRAELSATAAEAQSLREQRAADEARVFEAEQERVMAEYGVDEDTIAPFTSISALRGAETLLRQKETHKPNADFTPEADAEPEVDLPDVSAEMAAFNAKTYGVDA